MPNLPKLPDTASAVLFILLKRGAHRTDQLRAELRRIGKGAVKREHVRDALRVLAERRLIQWQGREIGDAFFYATPKARELSGIDRVELSL